MEWIYKFPVQFNIDYSVADRAIRGFAERHRAFFDGVTKNTRNFVLIIEKLLNFIPWWVLVLMVVFVGWRLKGKLVTGIFYGFMLFLVGAAGYWEMMNKTLSIIIASVLISLIVGFILGVLMSASERISKIIRPVLDTMQTMPTYVYLIPSTIFFHLGTVPAVFATTIYAVVPMIRLTCLGIQQVDVEVMEAARAYGSTYLQSLLKVQVPQALPTIMSGVNQTIMMAMAMVVTCSLIGAQGLGNEVLYSLQRLDMGRGLVSGTAVVIIAIIVDRLTQEWVKEKDDGK